MVNQLQEKPKIEDNPYFSSTIFIAGLLFFSCFVFLAISQLGQNMSKIANTPEEQVIVGSAMLVVSAVGVLVAVFVLSLFIIVPLLISANGHLYRIASQTKKEE